MAKTAHALTSGRNLEINPVIIGKLATFCVVFIDHTVFAAGFLLAFGTVVARRAWLGCRR